MLNEDSSLEDLKSYLFAGTGATLGGVLTPEEVLNFIVAFDEEQQVDSTEKEQFLNEFCATNAFTDNMFDKL